MSKTSYYFLVFEEFSTLFKEFKESLQETHLLNLFRQYLPINVTNINSDFCPFLLIFCYSPPITLPPLRFMHR